MAHKYLSDAISSNTGKYASGNISNINNTFNINIMKTFPTTITAWNKLDLSIWNSTSLSICKGRSLQFVKPLEENSVYTSHNPMGIKFLKRLWLGFSQLHCHKLKYGFLDAVDLLCSCSAVNENTAHYFFHCPNFSSAWNTFLNESASVAISFIDQDEKNYSNFPLW